MYSILRFYSVSINTTNNKTFSPTFHSWIEVFCLRLERRRCIYKNYTMYNFYSLIYSHFTIHCVACGKKDNIIKNRIHNNENTIIYLYCMALYYRRPINNTFVHFGSTSMFILIILSLSA